MKKCPFCAEEIQDEAAKCKHCGEWLSDHQEPPPPTAPAAALSPSGTGVPPQMRPATPWTKNPAILVSIGGVVVLAVVLIFVLATRGSTPEAAPTLPVAVPSPVIPSAIPTETSVPTPGQTAALDVSDARVDGLYDGPKYDFIFKPSCGSGPCGGVAQSGAQFSIKYSGRRVYHGTEKIRDTCAEGGVHVQAPLHVSLVFRPLDADMIGDEWLATKVDIDLQVDRKGFKKTVRISPTTTRTLTCKPYHLSAHFVGTQSA